MVPDKYFECSPVPDRGYWVNIGTGKFRVAEGVFAFNRSRVAVHEAGHAVMAMILGLDILECDISRASRGQTGKCVVIDPDPVGFRRFLVSMGGVLAEHLAFGDDRGGGKDRYDAELSLFVYSSKYRRGGADSRAEGLIRAVSDHFREPVCRQALSDIASILDRDGSIDRRRLDLIGKSIQDSIDLSWMRVEMGSFIEPPPGKRFRETLSEWISRARGVLERIRGF